MSYIQDPDNPKKQVAKGITYPNHSFIGAFATAAEITAMKATKGSMAFAVDNSRIYIHDGTEWLKSAALGSA
tara:strand:- start:531 stop:746 length:216 start_codon:yes stop_codon:yes gene_type:complete